MARSPDSQSAKTSSRAAASGPSPDGPLWVLESRRHKVISRRRFAARMGLAASVWGAIMLTGLAIGMSGYGYFEGMAPADAFVNTAMVLSGMGPVEDIKTTGGKLFAGMFAIFSGFIIVLGAGVILAPVFHRVLHRFHMEDSGKG